MFRNVNICLFHTFISFSEISASIQNFINMIKIVLGGVLVSFNCYLTQPGITWEETASTVDSTHWGQPPLQTAPTEDSPYYGQFPLWAGPTVDSTCWGQFPLQIVPTVDSPHYGQFPLWAAPTVDSTHWGQFPLCIAPTVDRAYCGQCPLWTAPCPGSRDGWEKTNKQGSMNWFSLYSWLWK